MNCSCSTLQPALSIVLMNRGRKLWKFDRKHHMWFYLLHALPHITRQILQDPTKSVKPYLNRNALKSLPLPRTDISLFSKPRCQLSVIPATFYFKQKIK